MRVQKKNTAVRDYDNTGKGMMNLMGLVERNVRLLYSSGAKRGAYRLNYT